MFNNWELTVEDKENEKGSVTIFFSLIIICLITFLAGIFDMTRIQCIQFEAINNAGVASEYALSQYNPMLMNEYGLFAGERSAKVNQIVTESLEAIYYPNLFCNHEYFVDYLLTEEQMAPTLKCMTPTSITSDVQYLSFLDTSFAIPKAQILEYMSYRKDYLLVNLFAEKLDFASKATKSGKLVEQKDALIESLDSISDIKLKMMAAIDGIYLAGDGQGYFDSESSYVRAFSYDGHMNYSYFPESFFQELKDNHFTFTEVRSEVMSALSSIDSNINHIVNTDLFQHMIQEAIENEEDIDMEKIIENWTADGNESLAMSIAYLRGEGRESIVSSQELISRVLSQQSSLEKALALVNEYITLCESNAEKIKEFQNGLSEQDECITGLIEQMNADLNTVLSEIDVKQESLQTVDNIRLIKEQLESDLEIFKKVTLEMERINYNLHNYIYRSYLAHILNVSLNEDTMKILEGRIFGNFNEGGYGAWTKAYMVNKIFDDAETHLLDYDVNICLDYSAIEKISEETIDYDAKSKSLINTDLLEVFMKEGLIKAESDEIITQMSLPSSLLRAEPIEANDDGFEKGKAFSDQMSQLSATSYGITDSILINEYVVGMFSNAAKSNDVNSRTLNHYETKSHQLDYEVEYVINGSLNEKKNLNRILSYLLGIRFISNSLHLATNTVKRTAIMKIAMVIAGWWTGGIGAIILGIVIAAAWALLESLADLFLLLTGSQVPLIKTQSTWYTSIDGNLEGLFDGAVRALEDKANMIIDEMKTEVKKVAKDLQEFIHSVQQEGIENIEELLNECLSELEQSTAMEIDQYNTAIDNQLDSYLDHLILNYELGEDVLNPFEADSEEYVLFEEIKNKIIEGISNMTEEERQSTAKLVELKGTIISDFKTKVETLKGNHKTACIDIFKMTMDGEMMLIEQQIDKYAKEGKKIGKEIIHSYADNVKKSFKSELGDLNKGAVKAVSLIPSFSYEDYLRLFLLLPLATDTQKVARCMDLIQLNLSKNCGEGSYVSLLNYFAGVEVTLDVEFEPIILPRKFFNQENVVKVKREMMYYQEVSE